PVETARPAHLVPVEVRDLGIAPYHVVEEALRSGRVVQVVSVDEHQVQQRLPVLPIVPLRALEQGDRPVELTPVPVSRAQIREEARIVRSLATGLFVRLDRVVLVIPVVTPVAETQQAPGLCDIP